MDNVLVILINMLQIEIKQLKLLNETVISYLISIRINRKNIRKHHATDVD